MLQKPQHVMHLDQDLASIRLPLWSKQKQLVTITSLLHRRKIARAERITEVLQADIIAMRQSADEMAKKVQQDYMKQIHDEALERAMQEAMRLFGKVCKPRPCPKRVLGLTSWSCTPAGRL